MKFNVQVAGTILSLSATLCFVGCDGSVSASPSLGSQGGAGPIGVQSNQQKDPPTGVFGIATKCLQSAFEQQGVLQFRIACSPIFQGDSDDAILTQIVSWRETNCPDHLDIENATDMANCHVAPNGGGEFISTKRSDVEQYPTQNPGSCLAQPTAVYGLLQCQVNMAPIAPATYTTSTGAVFTQLLGPGNFGKAWKDPSGTTWSSYQGEHDNNLLRNDQNNVVMDSPATEACAKIGGSLPTAQQYRTLVSYFDLANDLSFTNQGRKDLDAILPDMQGRFFWSSSVSPFEIGSVNYFDSIRGYVSTDTRDATYSVRCVGQ
jgi:hypothetical protein